MTTQAEQEYLDSRIEDPELAEMNARMAQAQQEDSDELAKGAIDEINQHGEHADEEMHGEEGEHEEEGHEEEGEEHDHEHGAHGGGSERFHRHNIKLEPETPLLKQLGMAIANPRRLSMNALIGIYDAGKSLANFVIDTADSMDKAGFSMGGGMPGDDSSLEEFDGEAMAARVELERKRQAGLPRATLPGVDPESGTVLRDELEVVFPELVKGADKIRDMGAEASNSGDVMVQKTIQFAVPFVTALRLANLGKSGLVGKTAKVVGIDFLTNATVWDPHEARFGELLRAFEQDLPADSPAKPFTEKVVGLMAPYIDYVSAEEGEGEWEGRWRNSVDSMVMNAALAPFFFTAGAALKQTIRAARRTPQTVREMRAFLSGMKAGPRGPIATVEIYSVKTEVGRVLSEARERAGQFDDQVFEQELVQAQVRGLEEAYNGKTFHKLAHAVTGRHTELTAAEIPSRTNPFDFSGTYEGNLTPNARIPLTGATDEELGQMNAIIGKEWEQEAMAASEIRIVDWGSKPTPGFTRGASLFIAEPGADPRKIAIRVRAAVPAEHEFSIHATNRGYVVDVFPRFGPDGPVGITKDQAALLADSLGQNTDAMAHDYRSVYTTSDQYDALLQSIDRPDLTAERTLVEEAGGPLPQHHPDRAPGTSLAESIEEVRRMTPEQTAAAAGPEHHGPAMQRGGPRIEPTFSDGGDARRYLAARGEFGHPRYFDAVDPATGKVDPDRMGATYGTPTHTETGQGLGLDAARRGLLAEARNELRLSRSNYEREALQAVARLNQRLQRSGLETAEHVKARHAGHKGKGQHPEQKPEGHGAEESSMLGGADEHPIPGEPGTFMPEEAYEAMARRQKAAGPVPHHTMTGSGSHIAERAFALAQQAIESGEKTAPAKHIGDLAMDLARDVIEKSPPPPPTKSGAPAKGKGPTHWSDKAMDLANEIIKAEKNAAKEPAEVQAKHISEAGEKLAKEILDTYPPAGEWHGHTGKKPPAKPTRRKPAGKAPDKDDGVHIKGPGKRTHPTGSGVG